MTKPPSALLVIWTFSMVLAPTKRRLNLIHGTSKPGDGSGGGFKALPTCWVQKMQKKDDLTHHLSSRSREHNKKLTKSPSHLPVVPSQFQPTKRIGMLPFQPLRRSSVTRKSLGPQKITKRVRLTIKRCNHRTFLIFVWRSGWLICFYLPLEKIAQVWDVHQYWFQLRTKIAIIRKSCYCWMKGIIIFIQNLINRNVDLLPSS